MNALRRFHSDAAGNVAVTFALVLVPMVGFIGAAVDYSHGNSIKAAMQASTDATALALAKTADTLSSTQLSQKASEHFAAVFTRPEAQGLQITAAYDSQAGSVTVSGSGSMKTDFMGMMGFPTLNIGVKAVAVSARGDDGCVLALNPNASAAITVSGSTTVNLKNCSVYANSSSGSAMSVAGQASMMTLAVGAVGGVSGAEKITATAGIKTGISPVADPYKNVSTPFFSGCNQTNFTAKGVMTINPGVYCGGMNFSSTSDVTLNPGVYYVDRGQFFVNGGAKLKGTGVTFIFTSSTMADWPTAKINGGATLDVTAPTSGPTAGIVMLADRNMPAGTSFSMEGGAAQYLGGSIYLPKAAVSFGGGGAASAGCVKLIADTIKFTGESKLEIDCSGKATKPFGQGGVRLTS